VGTGNYSHADGETVTLHLFDHIDCETDDPQFEADIARDDFKMELETVLAGTTFQMDGETWRQTYGRRTDELVLAENGLYQIWAVEDSYGHTFITYGISDRLDPDMDGIARSHLEVRAERFFDALQEVYPEMMVATSAWTSAMRLTAAERAAQRQAA
jgi:hypothetical protein